jgi:queuine/archaeosine tRNA-ribosyltransferase
MVLSQINLAYFLTLVAGARKAIEDEGFAAYADEVRRGWMAGDLPAL